MKACSRCKTEKELIHFTKNKRNKDGMDNSCISCRKEYRKQKREQENPSTRRNRRYRQIEKLYGLTPKEYNRMVVEQDAKCGICQSEEPGAKENFFVDHCHQTGDIRGLLCLHCNSLLGYARDDIGILNNAAEYLRKHEDVKRLLKLV